jgi:hypothetical protein
MEKTKEGWTRMWGRTLLSAAFDFAGNIWTQHRANPDDRGCRSFGGQECPPGTIKIYFTSVTCSRESLYVPNFFATTFSVG